VLSRTGAHPGRRAVIDGCVILAGAESYDVPGMATVPRSL
jgi:hypothetical protein